MSGYVGLIHQLCHRWRIQSSVDWRRNTALVPTGICDNNGTGRKKSYRHTPMKYHIAIHSALNYDLVEVSSKSEVLTFDSEVRNTLPFVNEYHCTCHCRLMICAILYVMSEQHYFTCKLIYFRQDTGIRKA